MSAIIRFRVKLVNIVPTHILRLCYAKDFPEDNLYRCRLTIIDKLVAKWSPETVATIEKYIRDMVRQ